MSLVLDLKVYTISKHNNMDVSLSRKSWRLCWKKVEVNDPNLEFKRPEAYIRYIGNIFSNIHSGWFERVYRAFRKRTCQTSRIWYGWTRCAHSFDSVRDTQRIISKIKNGSKQLTLKGVNSKSTKSLMKSLRLSSTRSRKSGLTWSVISAVFSSIPSIEWFLGETVTETWYPWAYGRFHLCDMRWCWSRKHKCHSVLRWL